MYKGIQVGRGIAALLVVLFHLGASLALPKYFGVKSFHGPFYFGSAGVEFFFVLSGFIIAWIHGRDIGHADRLLPYVRKRFIRIYPTYWIVFGAVFLLALSSSSLRATLPLDFKTIVESLLLLPQDKAVVGGMGSPVIIVAWTLQYEVLFYLLVAFFIVNRYLGAAAVLALCINYAACHGDACGFPQDFFAKNYMLLFGFGVGVAYLCRSRISVGNPLLLVVLGGIGFFSLGALESTLQTDLSLPVDKTLIYGFFSAVAIFGMVRAEDNGSLRITWRWATTLGDASYSLYLIHFPLISILCKALCASGLRGYKGALIAYPIILISCIAASFAFHLVIEKPILARLNRRSKPGPADMQQAH